MVIICDVNYSYADQVYKYSQKYKIGKDGINYWYAPKVETSKVENNNSKIEKSDSLLRKLSHLSVSEKGQKKLWTRYLKNGLLHY